MFLASREVFLVLRRYAGHSKWQNIRHTKAAKDTQRSQLYTQLGQRMKVAIQENGNNSNPATNFQLAQAIEIAKSRDMPVATIQSVIKSTQLDKDAAKISRFSVKGPRGSILLVSALTPAMKKTKIEIMTVLKKNGGNMSDVSLENHFEKKGIVVAQPPAGMSDIEEVSVDHAIEVGAEEVSPLDDNQTLTFTCEMTNLHKVKTGLQALKYTIEDAKITMIPKIKVELSEDEMELVGNIIEKLEQLPVVVSVDDNIM